MVVKGNKTATFSVHFHAIKNISQCGFYPFYPLIDFLHYENADVFTRGDCCIPLHIDIICLILCWRSCPKILYLFFENWIWFPRISYFSQPFSNSSSSFTCFGLCKVFMLNYSIFLSLFPVLV